MVVTWNMQCMLDFDSDQILFLHRYDQVFIIISPKPAIFFHFDYSLVLHKMRAHHAPTFTNKNDFYFKQNKWKKYELRRSIVCTHNLCKPKIFRLNDNRAVIFGFCNRNYLSVSRKCHFTLSRCDQTLSFSTFFSLELIFFSGISHFMI